MTTTERNESINKSKSYFESLRNTCIGAYDFYLSYGKGDIVKGYRGSLTDTERYKADIITLWCYYKDTKGLKIRDMLKPIYKYFTNEGSAQHMLRQYVWVDIDMRRDPKKKLTVLKTLWDYHEDTIQVAKDFYNGD